MSYSSGESGDAEEDSYSDTSLRDNIKSNQPEEDADETNNVQEITEIRNGYSVSEKINDSRRIIIKSEPSTDDYNEMDVKLLIGRDCINLFLNKETEVQEITDIVRDMFGFISNNLGLEMNGELLKSNVKLKSLTENKSVEMKVVFYIGGEVTNVLIDKEGPKEYIEDKKFQNTSVQVDPRILLFTRETQTPNFPLIDCATNTPHTKSVQYDLSISPKDKILQAKDYTPHDDLVKYKNEQAIMIQKSIRRFLAQKRIIKLKKQRDIALMKKKLENEEMSYGKLLNSIQAIMNKRPVLLRDDFAKANALLVDWRKREKNKILNEQFGKHKIIALRELFNKEVECLRYIQKCRMINKNENDYKYKLQILDAASQTTKVCSDVIENENSQNAFIFKNIYTEMKRRNFKQDERITFLNNLKDFLVTMEAPECTQELMILIDREIQMMLLGIKKSSLEGSRKRLEELFLYLSTDPEFNPASAKLLKKTENVTLFQCRTCKELKPLEKFSIDLLKGLTHCNICTIRKELAHSNTILTPYKLMIKKIYNDEIKRGCDEGYINLLQPSGLYYLVQRIWQGRSCLSEESDLEMLRFIRWDSSYPWSPWNCILLNENEAEIHLAVEDNDQFYGEHFIKKIENKHLQAKIKFSDLEELNERIKNYHHNAFHSKPKLTQNPQSTFSITNPCSKKLKPTCILKEPVSDLVFARCNNV